MWPPWLFVAPANFNLTISVRQRDFINQQITKRPREALMQSFVQHENLAHYRSLLVTTADETVRSQLFKLIAEEERQQILQECDWSSPTEIVMD
jgi:hypothetical protein